MNLSEISKRVECAVEQAHKAKERIGDYTKLALELEKISASTGIPVDHIRAVSGIEYNSIRKVLKYKQQGEEDDFIKAFNKLEKYDQERVRKELAL